MSINGLLIDYEFCTGCHSCEVAGKYEQNLPVGKWCIKIAEEKPWEIDDTGDNWEFKFVPIPTKLCDLCADRVQAGKLPACVHHCQAHVMEYGALEELAKKAEAKGSKVVMFIP